MIEEADRRIRDWAKGLLDDVDVSLEAPGKGDGERLVGIYLVDILPAPPASTARRLPLQVTLRYLVTTWSGDLEEEHRLLGKLVFAAMEHPAYEVDLMSQPAEFWRAVGVAPRPSFMLRLPATLERPEPAIGRIRHPIELRLSPAVSLAGLVLGPGDLPLSGVQVELPSLQLTTRTDTKGRFRFAAVPAEPETKELRIRFKDRERRVEVQQGAGATHPLVIRFDTTEV